jgi:hypothetical protein
VLATLTTSGHRLEISNVTAGTYFVSFAAANGTHTGAYELIVVNLPATTDGGTGDGNHQGLPTPQDIFARLDSNQDGSVSPAEFKAGVPLGRTTLADQAFANGDTDHSGTLILDEFVAGLESVPPLIQHSGDALPGLFVTSYESVALLGRAYTRFGRVLGRYNRRARVMRTVVVQLFFFIQDRVDHRAQRHIARD